MTLIKKFANTLIYNDGMKYIIENGDYTSNLQ